MSNLARLRTKRDFAKLIGVELKSVAYHAYHMDPERRYRRFAIKKRRGGDRLIEEPTGGLKAIQRRIANLLLEEFQPRQSVHGFAKTKSIVTNARVHCRRRYVLNVDLEDFFPSINFGRVRGMLMAWPYNCQEAVATLIAQLCCHDNRLPQGSPASPVISNMICGRLDSELTRLAASLKCSYSRYADDLTVSTDQKRFPPGLARWEFDLGESRICVGEKLLEVVHQNGFSINSSKTRLQHRTRRQEVTGLKVNSQPNVSRRYLSQVRAMLYAWRKFGVEKAGAAFAEKFDTKDRGNRPHPPLFQNVVRGKLEFLRAVRGPHDRSYRKYAKEYFELMDQPVPWESLSLFYCYSHDDEELLGELTKHLAALKREGVLSDWHDRKILPGEPWEERIRNHLGRANIVLLLVSSSFLASDYCWEKEMQSAMERHEAGSARVVPVILRACDWKVAPLKDLLALPKNGRPVTSWENRDEGLCMEPRRARGS